MKKVILIFVTIVLSGLLYAKDNKSTDALLREIDGIIKNRQTYGAEWVPQGGVTVRPFEGNMIRASVSKGFRSPNIREMYMWGAANPDLKPESMLNYEVAVGQSFLGGDLYAELTAFFIDGKRRKA